MRFPRFVLTYPGSLQGGLMLFGIVMAIGIVSLYFLKKAYQAKVRPDILVEPSETGYGYKQVQFSGIIGQGMRHEQSQYDSDSRICREAGGDWTGDCCWRPKYRVPGVPKCSR